MANSGPNTNGSQFVRTRNKETSLEANSIYSLSPLHPLLGWIASTLSLEESVMV